MNHKTTKKTTKAEAEYVRDMKRTSAFDKIDRGEAEIVAPDQYPDPLKRFLQRERNALQVRLSPTAMRQLEALSRSTGVAVNELARRLVEQGLKKKAG